MNLAPALLYALTHMGNGNPLAWRTALHGDGGFSITGHEPVLRCAYSAKGVALTLRAGSGGATYKFLPAYCDKVAREAKQNATQLAMF